MPLPEYRKLLRISVHKRDLLLGMTETEITLCRYRAACTTHIFTATVNGTQLFWAVYLWMTFTQKYGKIAQIILVVETEENYRSTTRECVHIVIYSLPINWQRQGTHHSIRHIRKPLASQLCVLQKGSYWRVKFAGIEIFDLVCSCDLDLDPMTFIYKLDRIPWRCTGCANKNFLCQGFRKLSSDRHTHIQRDSQTGPKWHARRFTGGQRF